MLSPEAKLTFNACMITAAVIPICIRMFVRYRYRSFPLTIPWVLSDVFVLIALGFSAASVGTDMYLTVRNMRADIRLDVYMEKSLQAMMLNQLTYFATLWSVKASFLSTYFLRISGLSRPIRVLLRTSAILLLLSAIAVFTALLAWCRPIARNWSLGPDYCSPLLSTAHTTFGYAMHMGTDLPVLAIPFFILRSLKLDMKERFGATFLFMLGFSTIITSTIQYALFINFIQMNESGKSGTEETVDKIYIVATTEILMSILVVCGPSMRVLLRKSKALSRSRVTQNTARSGKDVEEKTDVGVSLKSPASPGFEMTMLQKEVGLRGRDEEEERVGFAEQGEGPGRVGGGSAVNSWSSMESGLVVWRADEVGLAR